MSQLIQNVTAHMQREEDEMFDEARKSLSEFRTRGVGSGDGGSAADSFFDGRMTAIGSIRD
jgi:hypothetical protein